MSHKEKEQRQLTEEDIKKMSYWEVWGESRKAGLIANAAPIALYTFMVELFIRIIVLLKEGTLQFSLHWYHYVIPFVVALLYYYIHELIYKMKFKKK